MDEFVHSGILGMKWGIRRYQNEDGTLTEEGRRHYGYLEKKADMAFKERKEKRKYANLERERQSAKQGYLSKQQDIAFKERKERRKYADAERERKAMKRIELTKAKVPLKMVKQQEKTKRLESKNEYKRKVNDMIYTGGLIMTGATVAVGMGAIAYLLKSSRSTTHSAFDDPEYLSHVGVKFKSGRYPWGSGERPHQHDDPYMFIDGETDYNAVAKQLDNISSSTKGGKDFLDNVSKMVDTSQPMRNYRGSISEMSDDELRARINRMNMEKQYNQMMNEMHPVEKSKGRKIVDAILKYGGPALALTGSVVGLINGINNLKAEEQTKTFNKKRRANIDSMLDSIAPITENMSTDDYKKALETRTNFLKAITMYNRQLDSVKY